MNTYRNIPRDRQTVKETDILEKDQSVNDETSTGAGTERC